MTKESNSEFIIKGFKVNATNFVVLVALMGLKVCVEKADVFLFEASEASHFELILSSAL